MIRKIFHSTAVTLQMMGSCLALAMFMASVGCKSFSMPKMPWSKQKLVESKAATPQRMAVIWTDDVLTQPGKVPTRGFGARVYFYDDDSRTIPVEGQMVVYAYDDSKKANSSARVPDRKFVFTPDQFSEHFSKSELGDSYSIWIPWDEADSFAKEVSLVPVFTSTTGKVVMGQHSVNLLQGRKSDGTTASNRINVSKAKDEGSQVRPVAHEETTVAAANRPTGAETVGASDAASRLRTTTIAITPALTRKMNAQPQAVIGLGDENHPTTSVQNGVVPSTAAPRPTGAAATLPNAAQLEAQRVRQILRQQLNPNSESAEEALPSSVGSPERPQPLPTGSAPRRSQAPAWPNAQLSNVRAPTQPSLPESQLGRRLSQ